MPLFAMYQIDGVVTGVNSNSITIVDDYAFLAGSIDLDIVDISDPCNPFRLNTVNDLYQGNAVIQDTLAYMAGYQNIRIVNISDPLQPYLVAQIDSLPLISKFAVSYPYIYLCSNNLTMQVIDISDAENPLFTGSCPVNRIPNTIKIAGNLMFVNGGSDGYNNSSIQIIDISNPYDPVVRYTYIPFYLARGIAVDGNIAYIAGRSSGMLIWDISNPSNPVHLGVFQPGRAVHDISIQGDIACLANELNGILLVDISNPTNPVEIGTCDTPEFANHVIYRGNYAYVVSYGGLHIVNVSDPLSSPRVIGSYHYQGDNYSSLALGASHMYLVDAWEGLKILDISDITLPVLQGEFSDMGAYRIQVNDNKAYIVNQFSSFDILDISLPDNIQFLGTYTDLDSPIAASISGNRAYVLDTYAGLKILNISDASSPSLMGTYSETGLAHAIAIRGNYAYIINRSPAFPKIIILNVSNPASPQYAGFCYLPDDPNAISIYGSYAYVVSGEAGLEVYQISNNTTLSLQSSYLPRPTSNLLYCFVDAARLYVSDYNWNEIHVFDLANPAQPNLINSFKMNFACVEMKYRDGLLYTANEYAGMHIVDPYTSVGTGEALQEAQMFSLVNYPNPFNPSTTISYKIPEAGRVKLEIYNLRGQLVSVLVDKDEPAGVHKKIWDAKDQGGNAVASGVYLYHLSSAGRSEAKRMLLMK